MTYKRVLLLTMSLITACTGALADTPPTPTSPGTQWVHTEAQLGLPNVPFVFLGDPLYTAASFESSRPFHIDGQAVFHTLDDTTLHVSGPISSVAGSTQGLAKYGEGTLMLSGANSYNGNTLLHEGTLGLQGDSALGATHRTLHMYAGTQLDYADGAAVYNIIQMQQGSQADGIATWRVRQGTATQYGTVTGSVPITKLGAGTLRLPAYVTTPTLAVVEQGGLDIGGYFAGPIHVRSGARLSGAGAIDSALVQGGATLAPGPHDAPGMMVVRHLQLQPGATLEVRVQPDGQSDKVQVLETVELAGQVRALAQTGDWQPHTRYTILQAEQDLGATRFDGVTSSLPFLEPELSYDARHVYLSLVRNETPLEEAGETPTEDDVAQAIDEPGGGNPGLQNQVAVMDKPSAGEALRQLSGSWAASIASRLLDDSRYLREAALLHAGMEPPAAGTRAWHQAWYASARRHGAQGTPADTRELGGLVLGANHSINGALSVSAYLGADQSRMWRDQPGTRAHLDGRHAGLALARSWRGLKWVLGAAHTWHAINSRRSVNVASLNDILTGRYRGRTLQLFTEFAAPLDWLGRRLEQLYKARDPASPAPASSTTITQPSSGLAPFLRFAWIRHQSQGYGEQGGVAALAVEPAQHKLWVSSLGLKALHTVHTARGEARLRGELAWHHAGGDLHTYSRQHFRDSVRPSVFASEGQPMARNAWSLQLGVDASLFERGTLGFSYAGQYASGRQDHGARVNASWVF